MGAEHFIVDLRFLNTQGQQLRLDALHKAYGATAVELALGRQHGRYRFQHHGAFQVIILSLNISLKRLAIPGQCLEICLLSLFAAYLFGKSVLGAIFTGMQP